MSTLRTAFTGEGKKLFRCQKSNRDLPLEEPRCINPKDYCKWRSACPIHLLEKEKARTSR